jgi:hypothetical protein
VEDSGGVCNKLIENLLLIILGFIKVQQQVHHDSVPLNMQQVHVGRSACSSEIPSEKAEGA